MDSIYKKIFEDEKRKRDERKRSFMDAVAVQFPESQALGGALLNNFASFVFWAIEKHREIVVLQNNNRG